MPGVYDTIAQFKADLLRNEAETMKQLAERWAGVMQGLQGNIDALTKQIEQRMKAGQQVTESMLRQMERYKILLAQATAARVKYARYTEDLVTAATNGASGKGSAHAQTVLDKISKDSSVTLSFDKTDLQAINKLAGVLADGSPVRDALLKRWPETWGNVEKAIINGVALGLSPREIAARMVEELDTTLEDSLRVARTEMQRAYREATRDTYEESGVVAGYKRMATKDNRTCAACLALDGKRYAIDEPLIDHPNGRCAMVPIVRGVPEVKWQNASEWFKTLAKEDQMKILGPGKWDAWSKGMFAFQDLAKLSEDPVWGGSLRVKSLEELTS